MCANDQLEIIKTSSWIWIRILPNRSR